jgi:hypothetical protein
MLTNLPRLREVGMAILLAGLSLVATGIAQTADGVILIDQARALAGDVTPGDVPGFPITISQPGSYRLSGNLTLTDSNTTAIKISAENVTLDLNGFAIVGANTCENVFLGCAQSGYANGVESNQKNTTVRNGTMKGMTGSGVLLFAPFGRAENLRISNCGNTGIYLGYSANDAPQDGFAIGNTVSFNKFGIIAAGGGLITGNLISQNREGGISNRYYTAAPHARVSYSQNTLINNDNQSPNQVKNAVSGGGNVCIGKPCE